MQLLNIHTFKKLSLVAVITALCVVVLGAYVRLSDAGLGCPDWPGCYDTLTVPQSEAAIAHAQQVYPNSPVEAHKAWKEMIHRYIAGALGLMILGLAIMAWRNQKDLRVSPWLTTALVGIVGFQAALGMWTVTMLLKPAIVSAHLLGGMSTLAILTWIAHRHWGAQGYIPVGKKLWYRLGLLVLFVQIFLGGWTSTNYAALACTDFPTCHGAWWPELDFKDAFHMVRDLGKSAHGGNLGLTALTTIQWVHRIGAVITLVYLGFLAINGLKYAPIRRFSKLLLLLLCAQFTIGVLNLVLHLPTALAVAHNAGAALLLLTMVLINSAITEQNKDF